MSAIEAFALTPPFRFGGFMIRADVVIDGGELQRRPTDALPVPMEVLEALFVLPAEEPVATATLPTWAHRALAKAPDWTVERSATCFRRTYSPAGQVRSVAVADWTTTVAAQAADLRWFAPLARRIVVVDSMAAASSAIGRVTSEGVGLGVQENADVWWTLVDCPTARIRHVAQRWILAELAVTNFMRPAVVQRTRPSPRLRA